MPSDRDNRELEGLKKSPGFEASLIVLVRLSQLLDTITLPISLNAFKITLQSHNLSYDKHAWRLKHSKVLTDTSQKQIFVPCQHFIYYLLVFVYFRLQASATTGSDERSLAPLQFTSTKLTLLQQILANSYYRTLNAKLETACNYSVIKALQTIT